MVITINININRTYEYYSINSKVLFGVLGVCTHVKWLLHYRDSGRTTTPQIHYLQPQSSNRVKLLSTSFRPVGFILERFLIQTSYHLASPGNPSLRFLVTVMRCYRNLNPCLYQLAYGETGFIIHHFVQCCRTYR